MVSHFHKDVVARLNAPSGGGVVGTLAIPYLSPAELADPARTAGRYRVPLLNQVAVLGSPPESARRRSALGATRYLAHACDELLSVARADLEAMQRWQAVVTAGRNDFDTRYVREYLTSERFRGFDDALVRLMELLELPGLGKFLSGTLWVLRLPYRWLKGFLGKAMSRPDVPTRPEQPILEEALNGWIDLLRKEAARKAGTHPLWAHIAQGFHGGGLSEQTRERFGQLYRNFQASLAVEVDRTARSIYEELQKRPGVLNTLRGGKFALDVAAITGTLLTAHIGLQDLVLVPLVASLTHQLVELLGKQVVDSAREDTRDRQKELMKQHLSGPLAEWLTQWPATGGSAFERLNLALRRVPEAVRELEARVRTAAARNGTGP
jgi:hypothetical protein